MRTFKTLLIAATLSCLAPAAARAASVVFVNEVDYEQPGLDTNEWLELAGTAGTNLNGWKVELVNGANDAVYGTIHLNNFTFADETGTGWGFFLLGSGTVPGTDQTIPGTDGLIQNGSPDGIRLIDPSNTVVQFFSYEGTMTGTTESIALVDTGATATDSLYKTGTGNAAGDFAWAYGGSTPGALNTGQTLTAVPVPLPASALAGGSLLSLLGLSRRYFAGRR
jgi:hypothetical protein